MKIKCNYCSNMFDDTLEKCPNCGAPNEAVVRTVSNQPLTIAELQKWYENRGLPPYEITRFFIGIDYKKPRAFGIYKDEKGKCIVYKNKDNGQRAIRYEGTDEAYAVNELYQRLKQEILEQKAANAAKKIDPALVSAQKKTVFPKPVKIFLIIFGIMAFGLVSTPFITDIVDDFTALPDSGYYIYQGQTYYCDRLYPDADRYVFDFDEENNSWIEIPLSAKEVSEVFTRKRSADKYYQGYFWNAVYNVTDFSKTNYYVENHYKNFGKPGYFRFDNTIYYHDSDVYEKDWYIFDDDDRDWETVTPSEVPDELKQPQAMTDYYYTPTWDSSTQMTDFTDSEAYSEAHSNDHESASSSSWDNNDDNSSYNWSSSDSWDSGNSDWNSDW